MTKTSTCAPAPPTSALARGPYHACCGVRHAAARRDCGAGCAAAGKLDARVDAQRTGEPGACGWQWAAQHAPYGGGYVRGARWDPCLAQRSAWHVA